MQASCPEMCYQVHAMSGRAVCTIELWVNALPCCLLRIGSEPKAARTLIDYANVIPILKHALDEFREACHQKATNRLFLWGKEYAKYRHCAHRATELCYGGPWCFSRWIFLTWKDRTIIMRRKHEPRILRVLKTLLSQSACTCEYFSHQ